MKWKSIVKKGSPTREDTYLTYGTTGYQICYAMRAHNKKGKPMYFWQDGKTNITSTVSHYKLLEKPRG
jgi:hypothetical protein